MSAEVTFGLGIKLLQPRNCRKIVQFVGLELNKQKIREVALLAL
jgi:hypothetical protein